MSPEQIVKFHAIEVRVGMIEEQYGALREQYGTLRVALEANTAITEKVSKNTDDIVAFFEAGRGTFKVLKVVGVMAKWLTTVAAAMALLWLMIKTSAKWPF